MNELLKKTQATSKEVAFFRKSGEGKAIFYRVVNLKKGAPLIDFVLEAWKMSGRQVPSDPLSAFELRSHLPNERRPAGYLSVYVVGKFVSFEQSKPSLPAQS